MKRFIEGADRRQATLLPARATAVSQYPHRKSCFHTASVDIAPSLSFPRMPASCAFETWGDVSCRRSPDIADRGRGRRSWAEFTRTGIVLAMIAVRAIAAIRLRARNRLHRIAKSNTKGSAG